MRTSNFFLVTVLFFATFNSLMAQDTLVSTDNTVLVGEIKDMDRGVISIETDFSDSDFKISWLKIKKIKSQRSYRFITSDGAHYFGTITTQGDKIILHDEKTGNVEITPEQLVYIKQVDKGKFLDVLNLSMDIGYSFTNAKNLEQINGDINADYYTTYWGVKGYFNTVRSNQKDASAIIRNNGGFGIKGFAKYGIYASLDADYFSNTEQNMALRSNYSVSVGKYFIRTNRIYFNSSVGVAYLIENYRDTLPDNKTYEGKLSLEYNMFDIGDLNLFSKIDLYPSFTEKGRLRTLFTFNAKYDLPRDFYIKAGLNYNYDTKPAAGVNPNDYVYTFGIGWEL